MRIKLILMTVIAILMCAVIPYNACLAAEQPLVTREYISKKIGGENSKEEKLCVSYQDLRIVNGYYAKVSFYAKNGYKMKECDIALTKGEALTDELAFNTSDLQGCGYVQIDIIGPDYHSEGVRLPLEI